MIGFGGCGSRFAADWGGAAAVLDQFDDGSPGRELALANHRESAFTARFQGPGLVQRVFLVPPSSFHRVVAVEHVALQVDDDVQAVRIGEGPVAC